MRSLEGLLRRGDAGLRRPRQGGAVADRRDPDPDPVLGSDDGRAEEPRRRRRSLRPDLRRSRPGRPQDGRTGQDRRRRRPTELAKLFVSLEEDRGLGRPGRTDLQHDRLDQRLRPVRPLRPHPGDARRTASNTKPKPSGHVRLRRPLQRAATHARSRSRPRQRSSCSHLLRRAARAGRPAAPSRPATDAGPTTGLGQADSDRGAKPDVGERLAAPPAPNRSSTTSWAHEEPQRNTGSGEQPGPGRGGDRAGRDRRRLPRLQRQQRPALRLHLRPQGAGAERRRAGQRQRGADRRRPGRRRQVGGAGPARRRRASPPNSPSASTRAPNRCRSTRRSTIRPKSRARAQVPADHPRRLLRRASRPAKRSRSPRRRPNRSTSTSSSTCSTNRPATRSARTWPASATPSPAAGRS